MFRNVILVWLIGLLVGAGAGYLTGELVWKTGFLMPTSFIEARKLLRVELDKQDEWAQKFGNQGKKLQKIKEKAVARDAALKQGIRSEYSTREIQSELDFTERTMDMFLKQRKMDMDKAESRFAEESKNARVYAQAIAVGAGFIVCLIVVLLLRMKPSTRKRLILYGSPLVILAAGAAAGYYVWSGPSPHSPETLPDYILAKLKGYGHHELQDWHLLTTEYDDAVGFEFIDLVAKDLVTEELSTEVLVRSVTGTHEDAKSPDVRAVVIKTLELYGAAGTEPLVALLAHWLTEDSDPFLPAYIGRTIKVLLRTDDHPAALHELLAAAICDPEKRRRIGYFLFDAVTILARGGDAVLSTASCLWSNGNKHLVAEAVRGVRLVPQAVPFLAEELTEIVSGGGPQAAEVLKGVARAPDLRVEGQDAIESGGHLVLATLTKAALEADEGPLNAAVIETLSPHTCLESTETMLMLLDVYLGGDLSPDELRKVSDVIRGCEISAEHAVVWKAMADAIAADATRREQLATRILSDDADDCGKALVRQLGDRFVPALPRLLEGNGHDEGLPAWFCENVVTPLGSGAVTPLLHGLESPTPQVRWSSRVCLCALHLDHLDGVIPKARAVLEAQESDTSLSAKELDHIADTLRKFRGLENRLSY